MGKKRLDSDKHYGGKEICSSPRQQGRRSRITSLYIRRRAAAVFLFSSLPISSTFLLFMSSWSLSFHSLTLRNATHWWLGAGPRGDQRGEEEEAGEKHREEPWSGLTYCIFSSQTCLCWYLWCFWGYPSTKTHTICPVSSLHRSTIEYARSKNIWANIFSINNLYV